MDKWNYDKYVNPVLDQLQILKGTLNHRISNKDSNLKCIEDLYITYFTGPLNFEDPMYGLQESLKPELFFEEGYGDKLSIKTLKEIENREFSFRPGDVMGSFSHQIDIMILNIKFDQLINNKIDSETRLSFTNRDRSFEGTFEDHAQRAITINTSLSIEPLIYLDYHNIVNDKNKLNEDLNSDIYDTDKIEAFDIGWQDGNMKAYKIQINQPN